MQSTIHLNNDCFEIKPWDKIFTLPISSHDKRYLSILEKYGFNSIPIPIPLKERYIKGRKWSKKEFEICFNAWKNGLSLTLIAANLNRNPQDMIYKLIDRCKREGIKFTQKGRSESTDNWTNKVKSCAEELFKSGLPAWKIAVLFKIDFEYIEKKLFSNRKDYGHNKKNPFSINTDHKQYVNELIVSNISEDNINVLEAFAGEGRFTKILLDNEVVNHITCLENNENTFSILSSNIKSKNANLIFDDNLNFLKKNIGIKFNLIDLDPFVTCHEQLRIIWNYLEDSSYLFITFGGEYRRSFINTNRKSIFERYGFYSSKLKNSEYLEQIPFYFLGFVAKQAFINGYSFKVIRAVRYANNCRYWLKVKKNKKSYEWYKNHTIENEKGILFTSLKIPRFKEVRKEIDDAKKMGYSR